MNLGLQSNNSQSAIELLLTKPDLLTNLRKSYMGNYGVILSLLGCLEHGLKAKKLADRVIDSCMHMFVYPRYHLLTQAWFRRSGHQLTRGHLHAPYSLFVDDNDE